MVNRNNFSEWRQLIKINKLSKVLNMVDKNDIIGTWILVDRGTDDLVDAEL